MKEHFNSIVSIVISVLTLLLSIFISILLNEAGWFIVIVALLFIVVLCILFFKISVIPLSRKIDRIIGGQTDNSDLTILTENQLAKFELDEKLEELWIITADLSFDTDNSVFEETITNNLKNNVKYTYFVPNSQIVRSRKRQLENKNRQIQFTFLEDNFFFFAPNLDCVLHFYKNKTSDGFIGLTMNNKRYYIKMSNELFHATYGNLFPHIEA